MTQLAAFIRRQDNDVRAIVFLYENIQIKAVQDPPKDVQGAILYPKVLPPIDPKPVLGNVNHGRTTIDMLGQLNAHISMEPPRIRPVPVADKLPKPYILNGDVTIEFGPLIGNDQLITSLVTQHKDLKAASIAIINGAPPWAA